MMNVKVWPSSLNLARYREIRRSAGFTLLELLLAIAIAAITASVLYASLSIAFNVRDAVTEELRIASTGRSALEVVGADLRRAARPTGILAGAFIGDAGQGGLGRPADQLSFFTNNPFMLADEPMGEVFEVWIGLVDTPRASDNQSGPEVTSARRLVRGVRTNLLAPVKEEPVTQVLARRVWALEMRYHDGNSWQDTWDSTMHGNALPMAVELTVHLLPEHIDFSASWSELEAQAIPVVRTFHLLKGTGDVTRQEQGL